MNETTKPRTGHCSSPVYAVEARIGCDLPPGEIAGQTFDGVWRRVDFARTAVGVGVPPRLYNALAEEQGYLGWESAMALAFWLLALDPRLCLETRLVEHAFVYDFSVTRGAEGDPLKHRVWVQQLGSQIALAADAPKDAR